MNKHIISIAVALSFANAAQAAPLGNGGFESGLGGWSLGGDGVATGTAFGIGPAAGSRQLLLSTASAGFADDAPAAIGGFNVSGGDPLSAGFALEDFLSLAPGALDPDAANALQAYEGSAVRQAFDAAAGSVLTLRYNFLSNEVGTAAMPDYAFAVVDGQLMKLATPASASIAWNGTGVQSGYSDFSFTFATGGTHTLSLGVVDVGDYDRSSLLAVDAVSVSAVPEPSIWLLMAAGLGGLALTRRRAR
jgi:hypothetical protein